MHGQTSESNGPRLTMAFAHLGGVGTAAYFLAGGGLSLREAVLLGCGLIYFLRYLLTAFYLLHRGVGWPEAAQVAPFLFGLQAFLGYLGSGSMVSWRWVDWGACGLYAAGSFLNTASEIQRRRWKQAPDHKGHLYTDGLFALSMHINYFGDALLFTGFALLTTSPWALLLPLLMTTLFVFVHIPTLDGYLAKRYPDEFAEWTTRTKKLVPFIY